MANLGTHVNDADAGMLDHTVKIGGAWYARIGNETLGPLDSPDEAQACVQLLTAVAAARGLTDGPMPS